MKAVYVNFDPYLQAFVDWLNAGKPGDAPKFSPLPVAVTIPVGEAAALYLTADDGSGSRVQTVTLDGQSVSVTVDISGSPTTIAANVTPGLSKLVPLVPFDVVSLSGDVSVEIGLSDTETVDVDFSIPVLVQFEKASGPVDLVDFTPPAAAPSAADIKSALVAAGSGALDGVLLNGARYLQPGEEESSGIYPGESVSEYQLALILTSPGS